MRNVSTWKVLARAAMSLVLATTLTMPVAPAFAGEDGGLEADGEQVTIIVRLGEPTGSHGRLSAMGVSTMRHYAMLAEVCAIARRHEAASRANGELLGILSQGGDVEMVADYRHVFDGFAVTVPRLALDDVRAIDGVSEAFIEHEYKSPEEAAGGAFDSIGNQSALDMTSADRVNQKGDGQVICVIDTGVDVSHEAFSGDLDDARVAWTQSSIAAKRAELSNGGEQARYVNEKIPFAWDYGDNDDDPKGFNNHGTHVAGIAVANAGKVRGTAPDAQLLAMRVARDRDGSMVDSAILAALDDACVLEPDVINMSLGMDGGFFADATNVYSAAFKSLDQAGCTLCISAGNAYYSTYRQAGVENRPLATDPDVGTIASPSAHSESFSVASADAASSVACFTSSEGEKVACVQALGSDGKPGKLFSSVASGVYSYVDAGAADAASIAALKAGCDDFSQVFVMVDEQFETSLALSERVAAIAELGPAAILIYGAQGDALEPSRIAASSTGGGLVAAGIDGRVQSTGGMPWTSRVVVDILRSDAEKLLAAETKTVGVVQGLTMPAAGAYAVSDFSSWGPTPELKLKPEITGPGGNIYSSVYDNGYDYMSGTSMSSPAIAGLSALVNEYVSSDEKFAGYSEAEKHGLVTQLLMSTAIPLENASLEGSYYAPRQQGAGLANVAAATSTPVYLRVAGAEDPSRPKAELGSSKQGSWSFTVELVNAGDRDVRYRPQTVALAEQISNDGRFQQRSADYAGAGIEIAYAGPAYDEASRMVSVAAGATSSCTVSITCAEEFKQAVAAASNGTFVEGFARLMAEDGSCADLSVPYLGFYGDWNAVPVFDALAGSGASAHVQATKLFTMNGSSNNVLGVSPFNIYASDRDVDFSRIVVSRSNIEGTYATQDVAAAPSTVAPHTGLLRSPARLEYLYRNDQGVIVKRYGYDYVTKSLIYSGSTFPEADLSWPLFTGYDEQGEPLPDGAYTLEEVATVAGGGGTQSQTFTFYIDTEPPTVSDAIVVGEGEDAAYALTVADDTYIAAVDFTDGSDRGYYYRVDASKLDPVRVEGGKRVYEISVKKADVQAAWEVAGHDGSLPDTPQVTVWDYGLNWSEMKYGVTADDFVVEGGVLKGYTGTSTFVKIPEGVVGIADEAFAFSKVRSVTIPSSVRSIGKRAFYSASGLLDVTFDDTAADPSRLVSIGDEAFSQTGISKLVLPDSVTQVGKQAFAATSLSVADFGEKARIAFDTFAGSNPAHVVMRGASSYAASNETGLSTRPIETAYFGEGVTRAEFMTKQSGKTFAVATPKVMVVPSTMKRLTLAPDQVKTAFTADDRTVLVRYDVGDVVVYAPEDTDGWNTASAALTAIGADPATQLRPIAQLDAATVEQMAAVGARDRDVEKSKKDQVLSGTKSFRKTVGDKAFSLDVKSNAKNAELTYKSSNAKAASVDAKGVVTPKGPGNATIAVTASADGYRDASYSVAISVLGVQKLTGSKLISKVFGSKAFALGVKTNAKGAVFAYKTSNAKVATVDKAGKVTLRGAGAAVVTATSKASGYRDGSCKVTVKATLSKPVLTSAAKSSSRGKLTAAWKALKGAQGYQLKVGSKTYSIKGAKAVKKTVTAAQGKTVQVRVRAYSKASGKTVWSPWSAAKSVKVRK